ncbi:YDG domain-containing protein [Flavobacterium pallidum]|nr:YDG domain-containing protein [Flavobacterium pallidum]
MKTILRKNILKGFVVAVLLLMSFSSSAQTLLDSFGDGNFTASPVWGGNTTLWGIQTNSDAAAGATGSNTLRQNSPATAQTDYLSTQITTWGTTQEWGFWVGRRAQAYTAANQMYIWLYANEATLNNATVDGYRIAIGDDTGGDEIRLEYVVNGTVSATVITSSGAMTNGITDIGFLVRVTRNTSGQWQIFTSTLPSANGNGAIATAVPDSTNATVNQGTGTNNTLPPASNGYFGVAAIHSTGANALTANELDQIYFTQASSSATITGAATATAFTTTYGTASAAQSFAVSGSNLTADITATAPTGYEVASDGVTFATTATITQSGGTASGNISIRLKANAVVGGSYNGQTIVLTSGSATAVNITTAASGNTVSPLGVTLSGVLVNNKSYNGNTSGTFNLGGATVAGTLFSDVVTINSASATATFASANVGTGIGVTAAGFAISGANTGNYTLSAQPTGLTADITQASQTITFGTLADKQSTDPPFGLTGTASSGLTVTYISSNPSVATVSGSTVTITGAGDTTITAQQAGNTNYSAAADVPQNLHVNASVKSGQTITFGALSPVTYGAADFALTATSDSGLTVTYLSSDPTVASVSGSMVTIHKPGTTNITAQQAGDINYNPAVDVVQSLTVNTKTLTVTGATAQSKVYDGNANATITGATLVGIVGSDNVTVSGGGTFSSAAVGTGKTVTPALTLGGTEASRYALTQPTGLTADITALVVNHMVISQVYGGGGNTSATYTNDFVELFNPTASPINLNNYTVQYAAATSSSWTSTGNLGNVTVQPGKYFLIRLASGANGVALPTSDFAATGINMSATAGKVALTNTTTALAATNPSGGAVVDLFGFGTANGFEGTVATALSGNVNSYTRNNSGCLDTNNNNTDFSNNTVASARNSATTANFCNPTISGAATATAFTTTYGTASAAQTFSITGGALTANITATAPTGFEVASDGATYGATATFVQTAGNVSGTLSVRLAATAAVTGTYNSQNIVLSSTGASSINIATTASGNTVSPAALTITGLTGSNKIYDRNITASFTGTAAYSGLQNGESFPVSGTPSASFLTPGVANGKTINVAGYTTPSSNYTLTQPTLSGNITPVDVLITGVTANNKPYDGNNTATLNTGSAAVTNVISPDVVTVNSAGASATFATANAGNGIAVTVIGFTLNGVDAVNYHLVSQPSGLTANITKASQTITFGPLASRPDNDPPFALTATASSGLTVTYMSSDTNVATVAGNIVTIVGAGTTTITASQAGNSNYDAAADVPQSQLITTTTKSDQVITFNALTPVTYGDADFALTATSDSGLTVTYISSDPGVASVSGNMVTIHTPGMTTITAQQAGNSSYNAAPDVNQLLTVNTKNLTVTGATAVSKEYDTNNIAAITGATLVGIVGSDIVTVSGNGTFNNANAANAKPVTAALTLGGADNAKYTLLQPTGLSANITPKAVTVSGITASNKQYDATTAASLTGTATLNGVFPADAANVAFDFSSGTANFVSPVVGTGITVNATGYGLTGTAAGNYSLTQPAGLSANITVKTLTLTGFAFNNKTYDGNNTISITGTPALSGIIGSEDVSLSGTLTASFPSAAVGANYSISITGLSLAGTDSGNYTLDTTGHTASIAPAILTYTADPATRVYNTANPAFTGNVTGFVNGETLATATTGTAVFTTTATMASPVASYSLNGSGLSATNYSFVQAPGNATAFTITQATQSITFGTLANKTTADAPFALTGTASSGLTVAYSSSNPAVATVSGSTVTITGAGTTTITATQAGNANYSAATPVPQTLTVTAAPVSIIAWNVSTEPGGTNFFGNSPLSPTTSAAHVVNGSLIRGSGVATSNTPSATGAARGWGGIGWAANVAAGVSGNKFITFSTQAATDYTLSLTSVNPFSYRRSSTGASSAELQYAIDGGAFTTITTYNLSNTSSSGATLSTDLTGITALQNVPSTSVITFRIVPFGASSTTGTFYIFDVANSVASDLSVNGITTYSPTNQAPTATAVSVTGTPTIGQTLTGSYTYNDNEGDLEGTSTYRWFRADDISGSNESAIPGATATTYQLTSTDLNKYVRFGVTPKAATGTPTGIEAYSSPRLLVSPAGDAASTITADPTFTETQNINYAAFTGTDVTGSSIEIGRFLVNDIIGTPGDAFTTKLTDLTLSLSNSANFEKVALYDDTNTEITEITAAASLHFTGLAIEAASAASKSFSVRAAYKTVVTDNQQSQLTVTAAVADSSGSIFAAANAGGASSSVTGDANRIEVSATALAYGQNASNTFINVAMIPAVTVKAVDANSNTDLDFTAQIDVVSTGTMATANANAVAGVATFSTLTHTAYGSGYHLTASSTGLASANSSTFDVFNPIFYNLIVDTNPSLANPYTNGQFVITNLSASGIGRGTGITGTSAANRYNATGFSTTGLDANDYFEWTLSPLGGNEIDLVNVIYTGQASASGPTNFALRSSVDGYTANIGSPVTNVNQISLSGPEFQNVSTPITFRLYAWGGTGGTYSINDFNFDGEITPSSAISLNVSATAVNNLDYILGSGPSASKSFTVTGANLTPASGDITVTSDSASFQLSTDNVTFAAGPLTLPYTGSALAATTVYVRLASGLTVAPYSGTLTVAGGGSPDKTVTVSGHVRTPLELSYVNGLRSQAQHDEAVSLGFAFNGVTFTASPPSNGYEQIIGNNSYVETPIIDFNAYGNVQLSFTAATFNGSSGQTLQAEISVDGGNTYSPISGGLASPVSTTYVTVTQTIDLSSYNTANGRLRFKMTTGSNPAQGIRFRDLALRKYTTWNGNSWSNGAPDGDTFAIIDGDFTSATDGNNGLAVKTLTIDSGNVIISSGESLTLTDDLSINSGTLQFENNANMMQLNSAAVNNGIITVKRTANIRRQDYVYWSSPVDDMLLHDVSPATLPNRFYVMDETNNNFASVDATATTMVAAKGYMVRAPDNYTTTPQDYTATFEGTPHNGTIAIPVTKNNQGYNMIGNPYPSAINANTFLTANPTLGTIYFWTHYNQAAASGANYATFNGTGAASGSGSAVPNGFIQVGQGFVVQLPSAATTSVTFNNGMRVDNHANQFFRSSNDTANGRLWLNLNNANGEKLNQMLVGYVADATDAVDVNFDGKAIEAGKPGIYSLLDATAYTIQGKSLPFADTDVVPLSMQAVTDGNYTISLDHTDGFFADDQDIFIKDNYTGTYHNIKNGDYTFTATAGNYTNRFEVVYQSAPLGVEQPTLDANSVVIYKQNGQLVVNTGAVTMDDVKIFDIRGRLLFEKSGVNASAYTVSQFNAEQQVLLIQVTSNDNRTITKKVAY